MITNIPYITWVLLKVNNIAWENLILVKNHNFVKGTIFLFKAAMRIVTWAALIRMHSCELALFGHTRENFRHDQMRRSTVAERVSRLLWEIHASTKLPSRTTYEVVVHDVFNYVISTCSVEPINGGCLSLIFISVVIVIGWKKILRN